MLGVIVGQLGVGLLAGVVAPLLVPGRRNMPMVVTVILGIFGSFVGGLLVYLVGRDAEQPLWVGGSIIGAAIVLMLFIAFGRQPTGRARPGER